MYLPSDPKVWQEIGRDTLIRKPHFWLLLLGAIVIAFGVPEDIFKKIAFLSTATSIASNLIPSIEKLSERSSFPNMTLLLFSYYWIATPWFFWIVVVNKPYESHFISVWLSGPILLRHIRPIAFLLICITFSLIWFYVALPADPNCWHMCIYESRILQVLYGFSLAFGVGTFWAMVYWWLRNFRVIHFSKLNKRGDKQ